MKTAFQIDPISGLNRASDTSLMLAAEAQKRGYEIFTYQPSQLSWNAGTLTATMRPLDTRDLTLGEARIIATAEMDVLWMRQDPPFDMGYITATHLLEHAGCRVVNDPKSVRNAPEKLSPFAFPDTIPPTLISLDADAIHAFVRAQKTVVAKPLYGYGGRSVFKFASDDGNLDTFLEFWRESSREPLIWQTFLPEVKDGDRRLLLINGELKGCFGRIPAAGSIRANTRIHGIDSAVRAEPTARQVEIAQRVGAWAKAQKLLIVGLDVIGNHLTEINVTSPTGFKLMERLYGVNLAVDTWDAVEAL